MERGGWSRAPTHCHLVARSSKVRSGFDRLAPRGVQQRSLLRWFTPAVGVIVDGVSGRRVVCALLVALPASALLAACDSGSTRIGASGGSAGASGGGGAPTSGAGGGAIGGQAGTAVLDGSGGDAAAGAGGKGVCNPSEIAGTGALSAAGRVDVEWCVGARNCATCEWKGGGEIGFDIPTSTACLFQTVICPSISGSGVGSNNPPACTAHPDGETYQGVLVEYTSDPASLGCYGLDHNGAGNNPVFNFDSLPCALGGFTCVPDCGSCP